MELIKKTSRKAFKNKKSLTSFGLFKCPFCNNLVEKQLSHGKNAKSCGCQRAKLAGQTRAIHGMSKSRLYGIWSTMKRRCSDPRTGHRKYYYDKGIKVCTEWKNFLPFKKWATTNGYMEKLSIDRLDDSKNYCPENCEWVTSKENSRRRSCVKLSISTARENREKYSKGGTTQTVLAKTFNVSRRLIGNIINNQCWQEDIDSWRCCDDK